MPACRLVCSGSARAAGLLPIYRLLVTYALHYKEIGNRKWRKNAMLRRIPTAAPSQDGSFLDMMSALEAESPGRDHPGTFLRTQAFSSTDASRTLRSQRQSQKSAFLRLEARVARHL
jgi:hypothetical protein